METRCIYVYGSAAQTAPEAEHQELNSQKSRVKIKIPPQLQLMPVPKARLLFASLCWHPCVLWYCTLSSVGSCHHEQDE